MFLTGTYIMAIYNYDYIQLAGRSYHGLLQYVNVHSIG